MDTETHRQIIQLILAYSLTGAFVITLILTLLSLVGVIKLANEAQQTKLFSVLIIELAVVVVGFFGNFIKFDPKEVSNEVREDGRGEVETEVVVSAAAGHLAAAGHVRALESFSVQNEEELRAKLLEDPELRRTEFDKIIGNQ